MMLDLSIAKGNIIYDELNFDLSKSIEKQQACLLEDLLQISFGNNFLLDLGWYPEFDLTGSFILQVIKNSNWDNPLYKAEFRNIYLLKKNMKKATDFILNMLQGDIGST